MIHPLPASPTLSLSVRAGQRTSWSSAATTAAPQTPSTSAAETYSQEDPRLLQRPLPQLPLLRPRTTATTAGTINKPN
jgi:hypothetical protein